MLLTAAPSMFESMGHPPDTIREKTKSKDHRHGEPEAGESVSLELLDPSCAEVTWLDSELSKWNNG